MPITIPDNFAECERGNTLLTDDEGNMVAWITLDGELRMQVSWCPDDYPALRLSLVKLDDERLAAHINERCRGWLIRKCNVEGINMGKSGYVALAEAGDVGHSDEPLSP